jgi:hypothetical protein
MGEALSVHEYLQHVALVVWNDSSFRLYQHPKKVHEPCAGESV